MAVDAYPEGILFFFCTFISRKRSIMSPLAILRSLRPAAINFHGEGGLGCSSVSLVRKLNCAFPRG